MADQVWRELSDSFAPQSVQEAFAADGAREVELVQGDAAVFDLGRVFVGAVCLCEGAVTLTGAADPVGHDLVTLCRRGGCEVEHGWRGTAWSCGRRPVELDEGATVVVMRGSAA